MVYFDCYADVHRLAALMHSVYLELNFEGRAAAIPSAKLRSLKFRIVSKYFRQFEVWLHRQITDCLTRELNFHHASAFLELFSTQYSVVLPIDNRPTVLKLGPRAHETYDLKKSFNVID